MTDMEPQPQPQPDATAMATTTVIAQDAPVTASKLQTSVADGSYRFLLEFGGQALVYWDELTQLYNHHGAGVRAFIDGVADALLKDSSSEEATTSRAFERVLELKTWLSEEGAKSVQVPSEQTRSRAFFSYPLIALTQAANYVAFLNQQSLRHEDVVRTTSAAIGHSQGVVSAAVFAAAKTQAEYEELSVAAVRYMFWHGLRAQEAFADVCEKAGEAATNEDAATPMLAVRGLTKAQVLKAVEVTKRKTLRDDVHLSLVNASNMHCVTGLPSTLELLKQALSGMLAKPEENQTRIPHSSRKPSGALFYLHVSCAFHSPVLAAANARILLDAERIGMSLNGSALQVPVYSTTSEATNLQSRGDANVLPELIAMQLTDLADWTATWKTLTAAHSDVTHLLDFGPDFGGCKLSADIAEGHGIAVVATSVKHLKTTPASTASPIYGQSQLAGGDIAYGQSWATRFGPRVDPTTGKLFNKFTRVLKKPPVMVAGMTPTTSLNGINLVAAIQNAGFQGELAAGGLARPNIFESSVNELVTKITPGLGISINMLYLNAKQWGFQFPMVLRMRKSGVPIESITIGAGIPTKDRAVEIVGELQGAGINLLGLKPGSLDGIYAVLEIARSVPSMNIMLQWTGGRAGGHHSFEDFHQPLQAAYAAIRRAENVLLVVGSGFGNWEDSHQYMTGDWSTSRGLPKMPVDGILLGSRVMVAKEAATEIEVKQLLVDTPGIASELEWEQSYNGVAGGVVTVTSELGEPIHKVANRCSLLWREFDQKYFTKPRDEMELAIRLDKNAIIQRLNADFQKPYFGSKSADNGDRQSAELEEMTYAEVVARMIELMFVNTDGRPRRWLHDSFKDRVAKFIKRSEQRFRRDAGGNDFDVTTLSSTPFVTLQQFIAKYPQSVRTLMSVQDVDFFLELCRSGGKPVNFVPVIDRELKTWFKKDSLWYSEDLDAVPNRDAQRVCILQGPVAVRYSRKCDEPVAKILGDIAEGFTDVVKALPPASGPVAAVSASSLEVAGVTVEKLEDSYRVSVSLDAHELPSSDIWLSLLSSLTDSEWLIALLSSTFIGEGRKWVENPVRSLLRPQPSQSVSVYSTSISVFDPSVRGLDGPVVHISKPRDVIVVEVNEVRPAISELIKDVVKLQLKFQYDGLHLCSIRDDEEATLDRVKKFYARFWVAEQGDEAGSCEAACKESVRSTFTTELTVTAQDAADYNAALGLDGASSSVPADFSTIACWKPLIKSVFTQEVQGNLLNLVHLKHSYKLLTNVKHPSLILVGDELVSESKVSSLRIIESGKVVSGVAKISRRTVNELMEEILEPIVELRSEFLIRGRFSDFSSTFSTEESVDEVTLTRNADVEVLRGKEWFQPFEYELPVVGDTLEFVTTTKTQYQSLSGLASIEVSGVVYRVDKGVKSQVGSIVFANTSTTGSPLVAFIDSCKNGAVDNETSLSNGGYTLLPKPLEIQVPDSALDYAIASRDLNPIHRSPYAAQLAKLPQGKPIMHGMWTATKVRSLVVQHFGDKLDTNVVQYDVSFDGMVYPGDKLYVQARHIGMNDGRKIISIEVVNQAGERVVSARSEVKEPPMAFVFTGQGSAEVGMGMDRYKESTIARDVWDRGDVHLRETFGFSILEIVRKNPSAITVFFGGKRGRKIRENYMKLKCEDPDTGEMSQLLPEINLRTQSFTFSAPEGLLFATQFSQPALVLLEKATFSEIQAAKLIPDDALFAGHSLGEYAGLSSFAGALAVEDVVEVVFLRGLIMQKAVKRDDEGRSDYGMVAANPGRVGAHFSEAMMHQIVEGIADESGKLLQVVNFNVEGLQYVVAGENVNLEALSIALSAIKTTKAANVAVVVKDALMQAQTKKLKAMESGKPFTVARGAATIPLVGIDVPFHSKELLGGVPAFRTLLRTKFDPEVLEKQLHLLVNRYIPNLVAIPFSMEKAYVEKVFEATQSPYLAEILDPMQWQLTTTAQLAHLLVVELLAYQFASPVQWIKTQSYLFTLNSTGIRRFVEIGPAATLTNMALRTLQFGKFAKVPRDILWYQRDREIVHFEEESEHPSASEYARSLIVAVEEDALEETTVPSVPTAMAPPPAQVIVPAPVVHAPTPTPSQDAPVSPEHVLRVLLALRLNKELSEVSVETDVKTLSAGKSAVQNEILGDLEKEFGSAPEGAGEMPLKELASKFGSYSALNKVTSGLISKTFASKMPGGFTMTSVKDYLTASKGLGAGRLESVLMHSLLLAPQTRLKNEAEAKQWLDSSVDSYATFAGVSLARPAATTFTGAMPQFSQAAVPIPTVSDKPVEAKHALLVLLSSKLNKPFNELSSETTIKELAAGKSAVQNEIVGDLEKEFGSGPDDAAESKLSELANKFPSYNSPGKVTGALIAKLLAGKMPGGFTLSAIKAYLSSERCLPAGRIESVLLHTLTQNPKQRFGDEVQAKVWLDAVVDDYARFAGIEVPYLSKLGGGGAGGMAHQSQSMATIPSDFDKRLKEMIAEQVSVMNEYLGSDQLDWHRRVETEVELREEVESSMATWVDEHGEVYSNGVRPLFDAEKERQYDSYWNWAIQDAMALYYRTISQTTNAGADGTFPMSDSLDEHFQAMSRWINEKVDDLTQESSLPPLEWFKPLLCNRATPELLSATHFFVQKAKLEASAEYAEAIQLLVEQIETWLKRNPVNLQIFEPIRPQLRILDSGELEYKAVPRTGIADSIDYVDELARGLEYRVADDTAFFETSDETNITMASAVGFETYVKQDDGETSSPEESDDEDEPAPTKSRIATDSRALSRTASSVPAEGPKLNALRESLAKRTTSVKEKTLIERSSTLRYGLNENLKQIVLPHVHVRKPSDVDPTIRLYDVEMTCKLLACMHEMASAGVSFSEKVALVTGCGRNSIGAEVVKSLLEGGATVFVTTSSFNATTTGIFRSIYEQHGSRGSRLVLLPFNQASKQDVQKLISHIYDVHKVDLDFVVPFAALSEVGRTIADIDGRSELSHRIMLTNTMRLLGEIVTAKKSRGILTRPALAVLPLSPNHGNFGGDGLYAESKLGVESLMNKWHSEGWEDQLSIVGAVIGWTRGTGLMSGNNIVAEGVEKLGVRTFSTKEMGFNLSALMHPTVVDMASESPLWADLTGGMAQMKDLKNQVDSIRSSIMSKAKLQAAMFASADGEKVASTKPVVKSAFTPRANLSGYFCDNFPNVSGVHKLAASKRQALLRDMLNLRNVVVVAGFGEVGPWGNSRTRWEMESYGEFSLEGCLELAWLTGFVVYDNDRWLDAKTKEVVPEHEVKARFEEKMLKHAGIRIVEPDLFEGYDPKQKMILHQVAIDKKMAPIEVADHEEALQFRSELGKENVDIYQNASGAWMIRLRKGAVLSIPRALSFDRFVAGQIPTGWSAERLGLSKDLAESVDPVTLFTLASTMDAFVAAGITDPYEFYQYVHVSEVGNTSGGGMGGMRSFKRIFQHRLQGKSAPSDTLQECFINTAPAWVNMLLLSSSGPIKTPVGACATAAESVDIGVDTIKSGKARVVIVGGYDDFGEEGSYEFAQMKATSDSVKEERLGREPREMCRPCSTTRGGFMESHGAGMQLLMDAQLAVEMGCPIYAIVALTNTATDKNGRSVPAPGQGILTTAREVPFDSVSTASPLLDVEYRHRQYNAEMMSIDSWYAREKSFVDEQNESQIAFLDDMKRRKVQSAQSMWGDEFFVGRSDIAPLRGALNVWNLTVDDIGVASFHGTGTKANDKNESEVTQKQLQHLDRSVGNVLPVICQKNLTGHPKGAAAAWMLNGLLQVLNTGLIPGNRNLDNTCGTLRQFDYLMYPNRSMQTDGIKAAVLKSFGFGQAGGEVLLVHPDYLLSTLAEEDFRLYWSRRQKRLTAMNSYMQKSLSGKHKFIQVKDSAPYTAAQESGVYLDPTARAEFDPVVNTWHFGPNTDPSKTFKSQRRAKKTKAVTESSSKEYETIVRNNSSSLLSAMSQGASEIGLSKNIGIGVDVEPVTTFENLHGREDFIRRNFTDQEMAYCYSAPHPASSFAGRWAAKEAVIKAISSAVPNEANMWKGAGAPLREIEIFITASGAPSVLLSGHPLQVFNRVGLGSLSVSISHSGDYAVAQAVASYDA